MDRSSLVFIVFLLISFQGMGQTEITVLNNTRPIGKNLLTGEPIIAKEYIFPERIHDFQVDTVNDAVLVQLREMNMKKRLANKGEVVRYDTENNKVQWVNRTPFQQETIKQFGEITLRITGVKCHRLNNLTGEDLWAVKTSVIFADGSQKIGIGYIPQTYYIKPDNNLQGINLADGSTVWQRQINRGYTWNSMLYLNDSTVLIVAAGLHVLNLHDGTGWDYSAITGKTKYGTLGVDHSDLIYDYGTITNIVSNVLVDSLHLYFASKQEIVKLNKKGEIQWKKALPENLTSRSYVFKLDSNLILVNFGVAYMGYRKVDFGEPFFASFNLETGNQNYLIPLSNENKGTINGFDNRGNELYIAFADHVSKYDMANGDLKTKMQFDKHNYGELINFVGNRAYMFSDSAFLNLAEIDTVGPYLITENEKILVLNEKIEVTREIEFDDLYIDYLDRKNMRFIANDDTTFVIDQYGKKIAEFSAERKSTIRNGKLYNAQGRILREIDLRAIIEE